MKAVMLILSPTSGKNLKKLPVRSIVTMKNSLRSRSKNPSQSHPPKTKANCRRKINAGLKKPRRKTKMTLLSKCSSLKMKMRAARAKKARKTNRTRVIPV